MAVDWKKKLNTARDKRINTRIERTSYLQAAYNTAAVGDERENILYKQIQEVDLEISLAKEEQTSLLMIWIELSKNPNATPDAIKTAQKDYNAVPLLCRD